MFVFLAGAIAAQHQPTIYWWNVTCVGVAEALPIMNGRCVCCVVFASARLVEITSSKYRLNKGGG